MGAHATAQNSMRRGRTANLHDFATAAQPARLLSLSISAGQAATDPRQFFPIRALPCRVFSRQLSITIFVFRDTCIYNHPPRIGGYPKAGPLAADKSRANQCFFGTRHRKTRRICDLSPSKGFLTPSNLPLTFYAAWASPKRRKLDFAYRKVIWRGQRASVDRA